MPKQAEKDPEVTAEGTEDKSPTHIQYVGRASRRVVSIADWAMAGISTDRDSEWAFHNGFVVPITEFTPEQLDLLRVEGQFVGVVRG